MKKQYKAPYLVVESFQLDAQVAASCSSEDKQPINFTTYDCKFDANGAVYFANANVCDIDIDNDFADESDKLCYHGPIYAESFMNS